MPVDIDSPEGHIIRKMVPFSTMPNSIFKVICDKIVLENARSGTFLFKRGDTDKELVYLLKGEVSLEVDKLKMEVIKAGSESARFALAHQLPRKVNGIAKGPVQIARLNSIYITTPDPAELKKQEVATPVIKESNHKEGKQSWISTLLMIPIIRALPPSQLSKINEQLEEVQYEEGEVVVKQGEVGEYFYLVKSGECVLSHKDTSPEQTLTATKLKMWDSFGAEALICDELRNHTLTALNQLSLLRINKENFLTLIKQPSLKFVDTQAIQALLNEGAILLDVRTTSEYEKSHLPQAVNVPLLNLRNTLKNFDKNQAIIVVSNNQQLSEAAAFLLLSYKFSAQVLKTDMEQSAPQTVINVKQPATPIRNPDTVIAVEKKPSKPQAQPKSESVPELLATENANLKQQVEELKLRAEKAEQEKLELTQKYQLLQKQSERLKAMLESLTKYNGNI